MSEEHDAEFLRKVQKRRVKRMEQFDALAPDMRELVNEYGANVVGAFIQTGVTKVRHIRHLVECVLDEFSPTRGAYSNQGTKRAPGIEPKS